MEGMKLLTVEEVTGLLRMSRDTVYRLAGGGQLPGRKIGRTWRFPADELERWLRERPNGGPGALRGCSSLDARQPGS